MGASATQQKLKIEIKEFVEKSGRLIRNGQAHKMAVIGSLILCDRGRIPEITGVFVVEVPGYHHRRPKTNWGQTPSVGNRGCVRYTMLMGHPWLS